MSIRHPNFGLFASITSVLVVLSFVASLLVAQGPSSAYRSPNRPQQVFFRHSGCRHLFYQVVGNGPETVVIPGRLFLIHTLRQLAPSRRLIFYDTRSRGKSDAVHDVKRESIQEDVRDLET